MERTTIMVDPDVLRQLRRLAQEQKKSLASVIRRALAKEAKEYNPPLTCLGIGDSGIRDTASGAATDPVPPVSWR